MIYETGWGVVMSSLIYLDIFLLYILIAIVALSSLYAIAQLPCNLYTNESLYQCFVRILRQYLNSRTSRYQVQKVRSNHTVYDL